MSGQYPPGATAWPIRSRETRPPSRARGARLHPRSRVWKVSDRARCAETRPHRPNGGRAPIASRVARPRGAKGLSRPPHPRSGERGFRVGPPGTSGLLDTKRACQNPARAARSDPVHRPSIRQDRPMPGPQRRGIADQAREPTAPGGFHRAFPLPSVRAGMAARRPRARAPSRPASAARDAPCERRSDPGVGADRSRSRRLQDGRTGSCASFGPGGPIGAQRRPRRAAARMPHAAEHAFPGPSRRAPTVRSRSRSP